MPRDISKHIVCGEVFAKKKNTVHGWLGIQGWRISYMFEITGNADESLAGHRVRFETEVPDDMPNGRKPKITEKLRDRDIGVVERFALEPSGGESPTLHMEWYGQMGHMLVRLEGATIEVDPEDSAVDEQADVASFDAVAEMTDSFEVEALPDSWEIDQETGLISSANESQLGEDDDESFISEMELMDRLIGENVKGMRLSTLFDEYGLPSPDDISEEDAQKLMKRILATLAQFGTAIHICEHYNWRDAYRMMHEDLDDATFHPQLKGTGWVQNYMSHEYCPVCQEEFDLEFERNNELLENDEPDPSDD